MINASDFIKFNSPAALSKLLRVYSNILSTLFFISVVMGASAASAIIDSILNVFASTTVVLHYSSSVVSATISTAPRMIQLTAPASKLHQL